MNPLLKKGAVVRLTKLQTVVDQGPGTISNNYWVEGCLDQDVEVGKGIFVWRTRNSEYPQGRSGYLQTTTIKEIVGNNIHTQNSVWVISQIQP